MRAIVDSSTLISLAWAGHLPLLELSPVPLAVLEVVRRETVDEGLARGYPDAAAIESAVKDLPGAGGSLGSQTVDDVVLRAAQTAGVLVTNDLALGRRAANVGVRWLRTADLVVLCVRSGRLTPAGGVAAVRALRAAGRITGALSDAYLEELSWVARSA